MAGTGAGNEIIYNPNNGISQNRVRLDDQTAPGIGYGTSNIIFPRAVGKSFIKWNTAADGSGTDYFPGDDVSNLLGQETNLYAIWGDIPLIVQKSSIEDIADAIRNISGTKNNGNAVLTLADMVSNLNFHTPTFNTWGSTKETIANQSYWSMPIVNSSSALKRPFVALRAVWTNASTLYGLLYATGIPSGLTANQGYTITSYGCLGGLASNTKDMIYSPSVVKLNDQIQVYAKNNGGRTYQYGARYSITF